MKIRFIAAFFAAVLAAVLTMGGAAMANAAAAVYNPDITWTDDPTTPGSGAAVVSTASALTLGFTPGQVVTYQIVTLPGMQPVPGTTRSFLIGETHTIGFSGIALGTTIGVSSPGATGTYSPTHTIPGEVAPPPPVVPTVQLAGIVYDPITGDTSISLTTTGPGVGQFHIIVNGDLSRPAIDIPGGTSKTVTLPGLADQTVVEVKVYGNGSGSGEVLATEQLHLTPVVVTPPPTTPPAAEETPSPDPTTPAEEESPSSAPTQPADDTPSPVSSSTPPANDTPSTPATTPAAEIPSPVVTSAAPSKTVAPAASGVSKTTSSTTTMQHLPVATTQVRKNPGSFVETAARAETGAPTGAMLLFIGGFIAAMVSVMLAGYPQLRRAAIRRKH